jgi:hypothetical protein
MGGTLGPSREGALSRVSGEPGVPPPPGAYAGMAPTASPAYPQAVP